jgi:hypothetical protein
MPAQCSTICLSRSITVAEGVFAPGHLCEPSLTVRILLSLMVRMLGTRNGPAGGPAGPWRLQVDGFLFRLGDGRSVGPRG